MDYQKEFHRNLVLIKRSTYWLVGMQSQRMLEYNQLIEEVLQDERSKSISQNLKELYEVGDWHHIEDLLELKILPAYIDIQSKLSMEFEVWDEKVMLKQNLALLKDKELMRNIKSCQIDTEQYILEYTSIGFITLKNPKNYYLHTCVNPIKDGMIWAQKYGDFSKNKVMIYGFGLGYHVEAMLQWCKGYPIEIEVYENNLELLQLAFSYNDLTDLLQVDNLKLIYDPDFSKFLMALEKNCNKENCKVQNAKTAVSIYYPSLEFITNELLQRPIEALYQKQEAYLRVSALLRENFFENIRNFNAYVDVLEKEMHGKDIYIFAAGPSLDKNVKQLIQKPDNSIFIATGSVLRKLLDIGITPDYVVMIDPHEIMMKQIAGIESCGVPMIGLATAYKGLFKNYEGAKYLVCQEDYELAEEYAMEKEYPLYQTGGSVSTLALDVAIRLKGKRIIFLGLDLAYTGNQNHASGCMSKEVEMWDGMPSVKSIDGKSVKTSNVYNGFREWIERRIAENKEIDYMNATEGGAYVKGMVHLPLSKV